MSLYGEHAREYASHAAASLHNAAYERPAMLALLGEVRGLRVLDAGCAAGEYSAYLLERGAQVVAIDNSEEMLALARERTAGSAVLHRADLAQPLTMLPDARFDLVISSLTLHYVEDWRKPAAEFRRVLRPGGRLLISTHHPAMTAPLVDDYFAVKRVSQRWRIGENEREIAFYHRPMQAVLSPFLETGFTLRRLIEPRLEDESEHREGSELLRREPWFLILDLIA